MGVRLAVCCFCQNESGERLDCLKFVKYYGCYRNMKHLYTEYIQKLMCHLSP